jgi:hypothetical protein
MRRRAAAESAHPTPSTTSSGSQPARSWQRPAATARSTARSRPQTSAREIPVPEIPVPEISARANEDPAPVDPASDVSVPDIVSPSGQPGIDAIDKSPSVVVVPNDR